MIKHFLLLKSRGFVIYNGRRNILCILLLFKEISCWKYAYNMNLKFLPTDSEYTQFYTLIPGKFALKIPFSSNLCSGKTKQNNKKRSSQHDNLWNSSIWEYSFSWYLFLTFSLQTKCFIDFYRHTVWYIILI